MTAKCLLHRKEAAAEVVPRDLFERVADPADSSLDAMHFELLDTLWTVLETAQRRRYSF
jgi:hypothetical protein